MPRRPTAYSQRDVRWNRDLLGDSGYTLGNSGCLVSCVASILTDYGIEHTPATLNDWLRTHSGYTRDGRFIWRAVEPLGITLVDVISCAVTPAPIDRLRRELCLGHAVVVQVDFKPAGTFQQHWVRVAQFRGNDSGDIVDPWQLPGYEHTDIHRYLAPGWDNARGVFAAGIYKKGTPYL